MLNPETAEWLAAMSGQILVDDETRRVEKNLGQADIVSGERSIRQADRYLVDVNMLLNLPRSSAVVLGDGLAKFVSIRPIKTERMAISAIVSMSSGPSIPSSFMRSLPCGELGQGI